jgi:[calcium/calmodulin-dependent protein kinase] kinase
MEKLTMYASPEAEDDSDLERRLGETEAHYKQRLETIKHHPDPVGFTRSSTADTTDTSDDFRPPLEERSRTFPVDGHLKGHAHDPLEDTLYLNIGHDPSLLDNQNDDLDYPIVSESPHAVEMNIYEQAYQEEMERILARRGREPSIYMTRRVEHRDDIRTSQYIKDAGRAAARQAAAHFERARAHGRPVAESGKSYAKSAGGKVSEGWASGSAAAAPYLQSGKEYLEPWKQSAKTAASRAGEKLGGWYARSGGGGEGLSGLVAKAHAKARGVSPGRTQEGDGAAETQDARPFSAGAQADAGQERTAKSPEEVETTDSKPAGLPIGTSVFKEHI